MTTRTHHMTTICRRFFRHAGAAAAVEFAMIVPVLLLIMMGVIELSNALTAKRKLLNAMQSTADLIGQTTDISDSDLTDIYTAAQLVMNPYDTSNMTIGVASVRFDDTTGDPALDWSSSFNGGTVANPTTLAEGRGEEGASIVIVSGTYYYSPLSSIIIPVPITLTETSYVRPRKVSYIIKY